MCWLSYVSRRNIAVAAEIRQPDGFRRFLLTFAKLEKSSERYGAKNKNIL